MSLAKVYIWSLHLAKQGLLFLGSEMESMPKNHLVAFKWTFWGHFCDTCGYDEFFQYFGD